MLATKSSWIFTITVLVTIALFVSPLAGAISGAAASPGELAAPTHPASAPALFTQLPIRTPLPGGTISLTSAPISCPLPANQCTAFLNWAGYAVCMPHADCAANESVPGTVTHAAADWVVPRITLGYGSSCSDSGNTWFDAAEWVGIDGFASPTVEQVGTAVDCYYGQAQYYSWYELYPSQPSEITLPVAVNPGDSIRASVSCSGVAPVSVACSVSLTDVTDGQSYTSPVTPVPGADLQSAEWIEENAYDAPVISFLALTQTSPILFTGATATIGGATKSLAGWGADMFWFPAVNYDFGYPPEGTTLSSVKAIPSAVSGGTFLIRWLSSGP